MHRVSLQYQYRQTRTIYEDGHVYIPGLIFVHNFFYQRFAWYKNWHNHPLRPHIHISAFIIALIAILGGLTSTFLVPHHVQAVVITWDGGGDIGTCGLGNEFGWSCPENWSGDVVPESSDIARFDDTSAKNSNIDSGFAGTVGGIEIASTYGGSLIRLERSLIIQDDFNQQASIFDSQSNNVEVQDRFILSGGTFEAPDSGTTFDIQGDFTMTGGTYNHNNGTVIFEGISTILNDFDVNTAQTFYNITINRTGTGGGVNLNASDLVVVDNTLTLTNGDIQGDSSATMRVNADFSIADTFDGGEGAEVQLAGAATLNFALPSGVVVPRISIDGSNTVVSTTGSGLVTFDSGVTIDGGTLNLNNTTNTLQDSLTIASGVLNTGTKDVSVSSTFTMTGGTLNSSAVNFSIGTSTLDFDGGIFNGQSFTSIIAGDVTFDVGGDFFATTNTLFVSGDWSGNLGSFNHATGTVQFNGSGQTISGDTIFYNLTKITTTTEILTLPVGLIDTITTTIQGTTTLKGVDGNLLFLRGDITSTTIVMDYQGARDIEYLDVAYNNNISTSTIECFVGCIDTGNNTNWDFTSNTAPLIQTLIITDSISGTSSLSNLSLTELTTTSFYITGEFTDEDGCENVSTSGTAKAKLFKSPDRQFDTCDLATVDPNICYVETVTTTCSFSACSGGEDTTSTYSCIIDLHHFASSSDSLQLESWIASIELTDGGGASVSSTTSTQVDQLIALSVSSSFNYGSLGLGITSSEVGLTIINSGNVQIGSRVNGSVMVCDVLGSIPIANQHYSPTPSLDYAFMLPLSSTPATLTLNIEKQTNTSSLSTSSIYWRVLVPSTGVKGICTGTTTLVGVEN